MEEEEHTDTPTSATTDAKVLIRRAVSYALVAFFFFGAGVFAAERDSTKLLSNIPVFGGGLDATPDSEADLAEFWKAWNTLETHFVETHASSTIPTVKERVRGAIAGLTSSYGDPYTLYFPPAEAKIFQEDIAGNFGGVGMEIGVGKTGILTVIAPLKESPAEKAGVHSGDEILSIDGKSTENMSTDAAVKLIRGEKGTKVTFIMLRDGATLSKEVTRDTINVPTINNSYDPATGVYYIALYSFTANSGELFANAIKEFNASGSTKLLIDLRGNPGGYLEAAVDMASRFLPKGTTIVTEDYRGKQEALAHRSKGLGGIPEGTKVAILIDQGSASASEILSGALQDNGVATLIGTRSFGKGSVQELVDIDGGSLKVTVARWLTPSGRSISDGGLAADIKVDVTQEDIAAGRDMQKRRAIEFLVTGK